MDPQRSLDVNVSIVCAGLPYGCIGDSRPGAHSVPAGEPALGVQKDRLSPQASGMVLQEAHLITPIPGNLPRQAPSKPVLSLPVGWAEILFRCVVLVLSP